MIRPSRWVLASIVILGSVATAGTLTIQEVQPDRRQFDAVAGESVRVRFRLSEPATVELKWFDPRDVHVATMSSGGELPAGEQSLAWNGRNDQGLVVPAEAYCYTIVARGRDGQSVEYDLTDLTGADDRKLEGVSLAEGGLSYELTRWSRVNIRIGLKDGGPLLRSLANWTVRGPGQHVEPWNGEDASGVVNVRQSAGLDLWGLTFSLPDNAIVVGSPDRSSRVTNGSRSDAARRVRKSSTPKRMYAHSQQSYDERGDFELALLVDGAAFRSSETKSVAATASVRVGVAVPAEIAAHLAQQRFEIVYFFDGQFIRENEVGALPATWNIEPAMLTPGEHVITVNLRGHDGTFGYGSRRIKVVSPISREEAVESPSTSSIQRKVPNE